MSKITHFHEAHPTEGVEGIVAAINSRDELVQTFPISDCVELWIESTQAAVTASFFDMKADKQHWEGRYRRFGCVLGGVLRQAARLNLVLPGEAVALADADAHAEEADNDNTAAAETAYKSPWSRQPVAYKEEPCSCATA